MAYDVIKVVFLCTFIITYLILICLNIGQSQTGIGYLKGLPSLKCIYSERMLGKCISEVKLGDKSEVKSRDSSVGIAATCSRFPQFPDFRLHCFLMYYLLSHVLMFSHYVHFCITLTYSAFYINCVIPFDVSLIFLYLPPGKSQIAVGNIYIYITIYCNNLTRLEKSNNISKYVIYQVPVLTTNSLTTANAFNIDQWIFVLLSVNVTYSLLKFY
jgi:hypothetical protein